MQNGAYPIYELRMTDISPKRSLRREQRAGISRGNRVEISEISNAYPAFFQPKFVIPTAVFASLLIQKPRRDDSGCRRFPFGVNYILRCSPSQCRMP
jgi:hypothetical protein